MKFYDRTQELADLRETEKMSAESAQMTMMVGRRRVGKTTLLRNAFTQTSVLYFFIGRKNEILLCEEFREEMENKLGETFGHFTSFAQLFKVLMQLSQRKNFTLIIDEFQEFKSINPSLFSDMQNIWDTYKEESRMNLVICGSIYSMMKQIFENSKEPLYGRVTARMHIRPFEIGTLKEILADNHPGYKPEDLLAFYLLTGGVAKYIEQLVIRKAFTKEKILKAALSPGSYFLEEGKDVLIEEFGKEYNNYFSILALIASSKTARGDIESTLNMPVGGYLDKLENEYNVIRRVRPFMAKEGSRNNKYRIVDNFLQFWFRFIYKYRSAVEIGNLEYVQQIVERDYETYSGYILEKYFRQLLSESKNYSDVQSYWNRKGEDEIDIIAINDFEKRLLIGEVKRKKERINLHVLENKAEEIQKKYADYHIEYKAFSFNEM
jgi:AAA+ ATPase superfamily predicted ATPase